ncbi:MULTISPECIES: TetR/AcrR family transcriptional regulator [unclassified Microbacterium]|uniref:TetR/AcrR family transcriptional regulator n=1 Tax=unclassified Microbacterium TaxID=2609290 RepID=UPI0016051B2E|nr:MULTISPECIES: TetR/AcrR family transcriptional regulator [unclassified Microbacterium]QNA93581.1 TetR family transcriptional regulator [Microbacterium sp. Se63.02b]QYM63839.1 TetR/AcrR family transcriptional regulator [Microbacterium sp. Se5.02b]
MSMQDQLRSQRVDNDDPRVLRTRAKLTSAYLALLEQQEHPITVTAVVERAGVTRSAFYTHFRGTGDLAITALSEFSDALVVLARAAVVDGRSKREVNSRLVSDLTRFIERRRDVYRTLLSSSDQFATAMIEVFADQALTTLRTRRHVHGDPEVTARYMAHGLMGVLTWWLQADEPLSADALAAAISDIAPADFFD